MTSTFDPDERPDAAHEGRADGDYRGRYGFGRRAHGSDASARYGFDRSPHPLPPLGAPSTPPPALEQRPVASEADDAAADRDVFREQAR